MDDLACNGFPVGGKGRMRVAVASRIPAIVGQPPHPAQHGAIGSAYQPHMTVAFDPIGRPRPVGSCLFGGLARKALCHTYRLRRAMHLHRAGRASRRAHRTQAGPQIHHRLRKIPGASCRGDRIDGSADFGLCRRQRRLDRKQPRCHPLDIGIDHGCTLAKGNCGNRGGGIGADTRQARQLRRRFRQSSARFLPQRHARISGGCARGCNSRAPPRPPSHRHRRQPRAWQNRANSPKISRNSRSLRPRWSVAASLRTARRDRDRVAVCPAGAPGRSRACRS